MVEPAIVMEIAFDTIQKSELHASRFALRFPRIVRLRDDKRRRMPTLERVEEIDVKMLRAKAFSAEPDRTGVEFAHEYVKCAATIHVGLP